MLLSEFDYRLPPELIAREPLPQRDSSRLLHVPLERLGGSGWFDRNFRELPALLAPGDLLIVNDARVIHARLRGNKRGTGGAVELLIDRPLSAPSDEGSWRCLGESSKGFRVGQWIDLPAGASAEVLTVESGGFLKIRFEGTGDLFRYAEVHGELPLPPYLQRAAESRDEARYQTLFAKRPGAVAAPTAGLHFTPEVLKELEARGVRLARLTLWVGVGTFLPIRDEQIEDHRMATERYEIPAAVVQAIAETKSHAKRVVAVGTTVVRALESAALKAVADGELQSGSGETDLFVRPGHRFRVIDGLLTNFHLPRSTLLLLVAALAGSERVLAAYRHAVEQRYRFFSYGDCCLFL